MKKIVFWLSVMFLFIAATYSFSADKVLKIQKQGSFAAGGQIIQRDGVYDNSKFVGWAEQDETGQAYHADHAFVEYQIPAKAKKSSLVFIHGYGGSGMCWKMTPDNRDGFSTLMLRHGFPVYVMDLPGRGSAGRSSAEKKLKPVADEMFWFDIWRIGIWPNYNKGVQFSTDKEYLSQFFRQMTPDLSNGTSDVAAIIETVNKVGKTVLVTHSAGGVPGWFAAIANDKVAGIAAYEPGAFVFPEDDLPQAIDGKTGGTAPIPVSKQDFLKLTKIPIVMYFGDYIPEEVSDNLGDENWRVRLQMARKFTETINKNGGNCTLVELPNIGIYGNTHFLMQDLNNDILADLFAKWLKENNLDK
ncbi:alpha/beta hydrolase [Candidatus Ruminimicrobium bovinum]|uniref:alpha/beta hydrolase n=1 Tax=Candidatus Ruminimicrobium bovinum TaxID=3242779 RepID=UPI0039B824E3